MKGSPKIYFIGIGGIGMSGLARYFKAHGFSVSGSDSARSALTDALRKEDMSVTIGHNSKNIPRDASLVIYNRAIRNENPELAFAKKNKIPTLPYAKALGKLTESYLTIAVTGSHGKSTTTALTGLALMNGGLDPTVLIGTNLKEFKGKNVRIGKSQYAVIEADDFGAAFLEYSPFISIITNIDREHLDFYKNFAGVKKAFLKFAAKTQEGGALILNKDDAPLYSLKHNFEKIAKQNKLRVICFSTREKGSIQKIKKILKIPGEHNLSNALAAFKAGELLKINEKKLLAALGSYHGAWRRMEYRGETKGIKQIKVFDDYAHHPTEIKATLAGFKEQFPNSPLICVFQPHQPERLRLLFKDFISAFNDVDILILLPAYHVTGREYTKTEFTSEHLASMISKKYRNKRVYYLDQPNHIKKMVGELIAALPLQNQAKPVLVMMGAGDIVNYTDRLLG